MSLESLYQQVILDHYKVPRNRGRIENATARVLLENPTCGDVIAVELLVDGDKVTDVKFNGKGCSISQASASMMTTRIKGKTLAEAGAVLAKFRNMMRGESGDYKDLGDLQALQGVSKYPVRIKCATLAWNSLEKAMNQLSEASGAEKEGT